MSCEFSLDRGLGGTLCGVGFFFQAEDGIRDGTVTGVQTCALPISAGAPSGEARSWWEQSRALFAAEGILAGAAAPAPDSPAADQTGIVEGQRLERIASCVAHRFYRLF